MSGHQQHYVRKHLWEQCKTITSLLCILQLVDDCFVFVCRFILENWVLDRWVRNILTVYPVVIVALVGNILKHFNPADPTPNSLFMGKFNLSSKNDV